MATKKSIAKNSRQQAGAERIEFIKSVKFAGLGLDETSASVNRNVLAALGEREGSLLTEVNIAPRLSAHSSDSFTVIVELKLTQTDDSNDDTVVRIDAVFSAKFNLTKPASLDHIEAFAALEARLIFFPYIRHFVADTTYRMSIDPIVLPMTSELENPN